MCRSRVFLFKSTLQCLLTCLKSMARRSVDLKAARVCSRGTSCQPGQQKEGILGRQDMTHPIVTRCHVQSCWVLHVPREHTLDKDSEQGVLLGWTGSVQPLTLLWPQNHLVREQHRPGTPHGGRACPTIPALSQAAGGPWGSPSPGYWAPPWGQAEARLGHEPTGVPSSVRPIVRAGAGGSMESWAMSRHLRVPTHPYGETPYGFASG